MADEGRERRLVVTLAVLVEGGLIGVAWLFGWLAEQAPLAAFRWDGVDALVGVVGTVPPLLLFAACRRWPIGPLAPLDRFLERVVRPLLAPCTLLDLLGISVLAGLGEEMLFRGVLQPVLGRWSGSAWIGLLGAALLFGVMHAATFTYAVLAAVMGAYLGWLFQRTDNLLTPVIVHGLYDFVVLLHLIYGFGAAPQPPTAESEATEDSEEEDEGDDFQDSDP
jgi:membrane protease YdiL (CAAX protease family)